VNALKRVVLGLARQHIVFCLKTSEPTLYLTFDDGPHPVNTPLLLDFLASMGVRASFFLVGKSAEAHPGIVSAIVAAGHTLGNHSFSHRKRRTMSSEVIRSDIAGTDAVLARFDGKLKHLYRPPWGEVPLLQYLRCLVGIDDLVLWSRDSMDYKHGPELIIENFRRKPPKAGDIILFHDDHASSTQALQILIPEWSRSGFKFDALPPA
jgi:peptidoglycan/xylan/chitin deacetylase (PgdA/CDA1 family)